MQKDLRNLFKTENVSAKKLPETHRNDFLEKLEASKTEMPKQINYRFIYKIAAVLVLFFAIGVVYQDFGRNNIEVKKVSSIERIEKEYLVSINEEWQRFTILAKDKNLINRYKKRLDDLDKDYQEISEQYKVDNNDILIVEILVENLQTRLQLLKDIQEHITLLNEQNEQYENVTI